MTLFVYTDDHLNQISFPLGGLGTGSIGLAGNGRLIDWEIFNRPNKGSVNGFSHFAIKAERDGKLLDARILHSDLNPAYMGEVHGPRWSSYGWGPRLGLRGARTPDSTVFGFPLQRAATVRERLFPT